MGGGGRPKLPAEPPPAARIETPEEVEEAKKKVGRRAGVGGRESTRFAGQLMARRQANDLKQVLG